MPLYDLECMTCELVHEGFAHYNKSGRYQLVCAKCRKETTHRRLPSLIAKYMGEKLMNFEVAGGSFDTMGKRRLSKPPSFTEADEHSRKQAAAIKALPLNASRADIVEAAESVGKGPSGADWRAHLNRPDVKEARALRREEMRRNRLKQKRAAAIKRGENINMRNTRLPGDPKVTG